MNVEKKSHKLRIIFWIENIHVLIYCINTYYTKDVDQPLESNFKIIGISNYLSYLYIPGDNYTNLKFLFFHNSTNIRILISHT